MALHTQTGEDVPDQGELARYRKQRNARKRRSNSWKSQRLRLISSAGLRQTRSDRNKSEYPCVLRHRPPSESGESAPFLRQCLDGVKSWPGSTVQLFRENAARRL